MDPLLFMSNTVICVAHVDNFLFWAQSQSDLEKKLKYLKEDGTIYNW